MPGPFEVTLTEEDARAANAAWKRDVPRWFRFLLEAILWEGGGQS